MVLYFPTAGRDLGSSNETGDDLRMALGGSRARVHRWGGRRLADAAGPAARPHAGRHRSRPCSIRCKPRACRRARRAPQRRCASQWWKSAATRRGKTRRSRHRRRPTASRRHPPRHPPGRRRNPRQSSPHLRPRQPPPRRVTKSPRKACPTTETEERQIGTGVVVTESGIVITNHHVIADASRVEIRFHDGHIAEASILQAIPEKDIAILQAKSIPDDLPAATLGSSRELAPRRRSGGGGLSVRHRPLRSPPAWCPGWTAQFVSPDDKQDAGQADPVRRRRQPRQLRAGRWST